MSDLDMNHALAYGYMKNKTHYHLRLMIKSKSAPRVHHTSLTCGFSCWLIIKWWWLLIKLLITNICFLTIYWIGLTSHSHIITTITIFTKYIFYLSKLWRKKKCKNRTRYASKLVWRNLPQSTMWWFIKFSTCII